MKMKWKCVKCGDIVISDSKDVHKMDYCKCGESAVDLEEHYCRFLGDAVEKFIDDNSGEYKKTELFNKLQKKKSGRHFK
jgi:hypothetical protein